MTIELVIQRRSARRNRPEEQAMAVRAHQIPVPHPRQDHPGSTRWFALAVLCVSILMVNLDNTVLNV
ncbi:MAG TPA: hypothetical protein VH520_06520, partial [Streptosporangiaceae bacterium]